jgi:hypothetical protein
MPEGAVMDTKSIGNRENDKENDGNNEEENENELAIFKKVRLWLHISRVQSGPSVDVLRPADSSPQFDDEGAPDTLFMQYKRRTFQLDFKAYSISDGLLLISDIRKYAAENLDVDPRRLRMLYKGRLLTDDSSEAKAYGLKMRSQIVCVVSEFGVLEQPDSGSYSSHSHTELVYRGKSLSSTRKKDKQYDTASPRMIDARTQGSHSMYAHTLPPQAGERTRGSQSVYARTLPLPVDAITRWSHSVYAPVPPRVVDHKNAGPPWRERPLPDSRGGIS